MIKILKKTKKENNVIKDVRSLFRLKKERNDPVFKDIKNIFGLKKEIDETTVKRIRNYFRLEKENKAIKNRVIKDIRNLFEHEEDNQYKLVQVSNFWSNDYIEYESNDDKSKNLSVEEYLNKITPYLYHEDITR